MERRQGWQAERMKNDSIPPNPHPVKPPPNLPKPRTESLQSENARLKAEVERLRKAGDAMADIIGFAMARTDGQDPKLVREWNAAKEGKPSV